MKILLINHEFPPVGGGGSRVSASLAEELVNLKEQVFVLTSTFSGLSREENNCGVIIRRFIPFRIKMDCGNIWEVLAFFINGLRVLPGQVKEIKPDIVYAFFALPAGLLALFLKKVYKIPYFVFLMGIDIPKFYGGSFSCLNVLFRPLIKWVWKNADKVIISSEQMRKLVKESAGDNLPVELISNGVDMKTFFPSSQKSGEQGVKFIFVGRLNKQKGLDGLLQGLALFSQSRLEIFNLDIVGDGPERDNLLKLAADLGLTGKVNFCGWLKKEEVADKYRDADLFLSYSLDESFGVTLLEAMACGLPVIVSDIPAYRELVDPGKNGILVPLKSPELLAEAIGTLCKDLGQREMMRNDNIEKALKYTWESSAVMLQKMNRRVFNLE